VRFASAEAQKGQGEIPPAPLPAIQMRAPADNHNILRIAAGREAKIAKQPSGDFPSISKV
jgi:hypothetical protein